MILGIGLVYVMLFVWLSVFVLTLVFEALTQDFVSIWFTVGSFASLCICAITAWWVQVVVFAVVSFAALICTRPFVKKVLERNIRNTNTDDFIGKKVKVVTDISKYDAGTVKLNGIIYTAILPDDIEETIKEDTIVMVVSIKGNKLIVKKIEEDN